jgi:prepilin-type N-terminal cleavage/methylation domain-containing protein
MMNRRRWLGFSLIELVIVIVILAVISAIALPRISRGAKGADEAALGQNLAILRGAIEMYAAEHGGTFPGAVKADGSGAAGSEQDFVDQLTMYTDKHGQTNVSKTSTFLYGPYLHKVPPVTVGTKAGTNDLTIVTSGDPTADGSTAWAYSTDTGKIIANCTDDDESEEKTYDNW